MKLRLLPLLAFVLLCAFLSPTPLSAKKKGYRLNVEKSDDAAEDEEMVKGSFMVASQCKDCNSGYQLSQVVFTGYDKPRHSKYETFFITNNTDRTLTGVNLYIEYRTLDGRMLHKRFFPLRCNIPAGETRQAQLKSWDVQNSFVYERSTDNPRHPATPYSILFDPVAYYLRH